MLLHLTQWYVDISWYVLTLMATDMVAEAGSGPLHYDNYKKK